MADVAQVIKARLLAGPLSERLMMAGDALEALRFDPEVLAAVYAAATRALAAEISTQASEAEAA